MNLCMVIVQDPELNDMLYFCLKHHIILIFLYCHYNFFLWRPWVNNIFFCQNYNNSMRVARVYPFIILTSFLFQILHVVNEKVGPLDSPCLSLAFKIKRNPINHALSGSTDIGLWDQRVTFTGKSPGRRHAIDLAEKVRKHFFVLRVHVSFNPIWHTNIFSSWLDSPLQGQDKRYINKSHRTCLWVPRKFNLKVILCIYLTPLIICSLKTLQK